MSFGALEARALLTIIGPVSSASASAMIANYSNDAQDAQSAPPPRLSLSSSRLLNFNPSPSDGNNWDRPGNQGDSQGATFNGLRNHVALSFAMVTVNGDSEPEFALADAGENEVLVRSGNEVVTLGSNDGIDHPQSVQLAYLNAGGQSDSTDPYPDLIVANSGSDNLLIFPGQADGQFGPALGGVQGIAVGEDPVSLIVADVNNDEIPDILVANEGSDSVSILEGQETSDDGGWNINPTTSQTIPIGGPAIDTAPVALLYHAAGEDGPAALMVANTGSDDIYRFEPSSNGVFDPANPFIMPTPDGPDALAFGRFDQHSGLDLISVNEGSNSLTLIDNVLTSNPTTQTISSGGIMPDAAFAFPGQNGMTDLVVANSGDGRLAFLQAGSSGLTIAGVISTSNLPDLTSLVPGTTDGNAINFIAATAGQDAAELLSFDLGVSSTYLPTPLSGSTAISGDDGELIAGLMPYGDSSLDLVAVFSVGSPDQSALSSEWELHEPSSITALYTPTEGQGSGNSAVIATADVKPEPVDHPADSDPANPAPVNNFVSGNGGKLAATLSPVALLARQDQERIDASNVPDQIVRLDRATFDSADNRDDQAHQGAVDQAVEQTFRMPNEFDGHSSPREENPSNDSPTSPAPPEPSKSIETSAIQSPIETIPLVSSVVMLSTRLILNGSPPRPPKFRRGKGIRVIPARPETGPS